jgi:transcription initiation factor TFIID TATA-box-binding protein
LGTELDLTRLAISMSGAEYEPESFPGLIFRLKNPKSATLLFRSGKLVCTGSKTLQQVNQSIEAVIMNVKNAGIPITGHPEVVVQNIVASADLGQAINLNAIAVSLGLERVEYEQEQFPGLVYRLSEPKVCILLFGSGRLVCTGARTPQDVEDAVKKITKELCSVDMLKASTKSIEGHRSS